MSEQLQTLVKLDVRYLELRGAWGKNVLQFDESEVDKARQLCESYQIKVSAMGSPIGKSPIDMPLELEVENLKKAMRIAQHLDVNVIRVFSFYPRPDSKHNRYAEFLDEAARRLSELTSIAENEGIVLLLENEKGIAGDTIPALSRSVARSKQSVPPICLGPRQFCTSRRESSNV